MPAPIRSRIAAFGSAFPDQELTNHDLAKFVDTSDEWISERTGIKARRRLREGENNSDIATAAARKALDKAGVDTSSVDMIIACTNTPDRWMPSLAATVQAKLGVPAGAACWDLITACAGWITGLEVADAMVQSGKYKNVLVIGSEALTRFVNWNDRTTCVLFGDGAGASLVQPGKAGDRGEILEVRVHADGRYGDALDMPAGGSRHPITPENAIEARQYIHMNGQEIFKHAVRNMAAVCEEVLAARNLTMEDIDWLVPHQANIRIIEAVGKKLGAPAEKVALNVHKYGNTSTATIPTCFDEYATDGRIKPGHLVLMTTFGGGLSWAGSLIRW